MLLLYVVELAKHYRVRGSYIVEVYTILFLFNWQIKTQDLSAV